MVASLGRRLMAREAAAVAVSTSLIRSRLRFFLVFWGGFIVLALFLCISCLEWVGHRRRRQTTAFTRRRLVSSCAFGRPPLPPPPCSRLTVFSSTYQVLGSALELPFEFA